MRRLSKDEMKAVSGGQTSGSSCNTYSSCNPNPTPTPNPVVPKVCTQYSWISTGYNQGYYACTRWQ